MMMKPRLVAVVCLAIPGRARVIEITDSPWSLCALYVIVNDTVC